MNDTAGVLFIGFLASWSQAMYGDSDGFGLRRSEECVFSNWPLSWLPGDTDGASMFANV